MRATDNLFGEPVNNNEKSYRALRHDVVRNKQKQNDSDVHHPHHKKDQIVSVIDKHLPGDNHTILELFCGRGNLTDVYMKYGEVNCYDKKYLGTGDSYTVFHDLISKKKIYSIIDLDPYGFPNRFFPDIFLLIDNGIMFITMPKPHVNILNGIIQTHLISYYGDKNPSLDVIINRIALWGLCHWRKVEMVSIIEFKKMWRFAFKVNKVKATEYTGVKNR